MVIRGLERKMGRDVKDMENPKKERCQIPRERKERGREGTKMSRMGKQRWECSG